MIGALSKFIAWIVVEFAFYTLCYGLGWGLLRTLTFGRYPPRSTIPHNRDFVAVVPIVTTLVALTLVYSWRQTDGRLNGRRSPGRAA